MLTGLVYIAKPRFSVFTLMLLAWPPLFQLENESAVKLGQVAEAFNRALAHAPLIPAGFRSFLRIPVPFQWNLPAKLLEFCYSGIYTGTVPGMDWNGMAPECSDWNEH
jgi:hypothetical protein